MLGARVVLVALVEQSSTSELVQRARLTPEVRPWAPRSQTRQAPLSPAPR
jgi:hypothetical protein